MTTTTSLAEHYPLVIQREVLRDFPVHPSTESCSVLSFGPHRSLCVIPFRGSQRAFIISYRTTTIVISHRFPESRARSNVRRNPLNIISFSSLTLIFFSRTVSG